ncbi:MAG: hypothetical protein FJ388_05100 [Verrucomicrobia bacterium]|nr:hypothetical protein [Verrucomicrobiota bacterium]
MKVEFVNGYASGWRMCVPECFRNALEKGTFAVGDVFYDTAKAYELPWGDALKHIGTCMQIAQASADKVTFTIYAPNKEKTKLVQVSTKSCSPADFTKCLKEGFQ